MTDLKKIESENWPVGTGEEFQKERAKEILPAVEVENTVLWVNPAFKELPFGVEKGKPTRLGMFFTADPQASSGEKIYNLKISPESRMGRSGFLGSVIFRDQEGRFYRDVDIKGGGVFARNLSVGPEYEVGEIGRNPAVSGGVQGILDYDHGLRDRDYSEKFLKWGIRTHRVIAIIRPEEIVDGEGKKISIEEAKKENIIPVGSDPVIVVRAFGTKERLGHVGSFQAPVERRRKAVLDAKAIVAQELGSPPGSFAMYEYLMWFSRTLGEQIAKMKNKKLCHRYLTAHNITLDCRIVDLDSVDKARDTARELNEEGNPTSEEGLYQQDYYDAQNSLLDFTLDLKKLFPKFNFMLFKERLFKQFDRAYQNADKSGGNKFSSASSKP